MNKQDIIIYNTPDGHTAVGLYAHEGTIWLNQNQIADLFATSRANISIHISNILKEKELHENSVVKDFLTTASDDKEYRNDRPLLTDKGAVSNEQMQAIALVEYQKFDARRKTHDAQFADEQDIEELQQPENNIKQRNPDQAK